MCLSVGPMSRLLPYDILFDQLRQTHNVKTNPKTRMARHKHVELGFCHLNQNSTIYFRLIQFIFGRFSSKQINKFQFLIERVVCLSFGNLFKFMKQTGGGKRNKGSKFAENFFFLIQILPLMMISLFSFHSSPLRMEHLHFDTYININNPSSRLRTPT